MLCQICDSQCYIRTLHKIAVIDPTIIIVSQTARQSKLIFVLRSNLDEQMTIEEAPRGFWSETAGIDYIRQFAFEDEIEGLEVSISGNFFAICCLAAVGK